MRVLGRHYLLELWGCNEKIGDEAEVRDAVEEAVDAAQVTLLGDVHTHKFNPHGVSAMAIIAESHISVHTWPEYGYAAVDVYTCGEDARPEKALEVFKRRFSPERMEVHEIKRGILA